MLSQVVVCNIANMLNKPSYKDCYFLKLCAMPKFLLRFSLQETNSCAMLAIKTLSVFHCLFSTVLSPFNTARLLNLSSPILDQSHIFRHRTDGNERLLAVRVAGFTASNLQIVLNS